MLVFHSQKLVVFSVPRTGSTSLHKALRPHADFELSNPPGDKHMNVQRFETWAKEKHRRYLRFRRAAVIRDPLARIASWYAYRRRDAVRGTEKSTEAMSFNDYVEDVLSDAPSPPAKIGNQHDFLTLAGGDLGVQELFCIERADVMVAHFRGLFGHVDLPHRNASPPVELSLDPALEDRLRQERRAEFALFQKVAATGHLIVSNA
ncbi:MAG: sulfotransferase family 2 domain-containing protein [Pseudomonadota bacterium]